MDKVQLKNIIEAALLAAGRPLSLDELRGLFGGDDEAPPRQEIRAAVMDLQADYADRAIAVREVASGFRIQVEPSMAPWLSRLWEERPPRYSRALMETLAIIAYRQPVTRGEIEDIRGVTVSTNIIRTLLERAWIRVVGHRDVPGKPEMFGTTRDFLDYFGLKSLDQLPPLAELKDLDALNIQLELPDDSPGAGEGADGEAAQAAAGEPEQLATASVASLDQARASAAELSDQAGDDAGDDRNQDDNGSLDEPADAAKVVPLKTH
ncbi:MAG TPA: SMC-Scp complex subunit ScpB [Chromatiales bacterium]|nr:SMC-Scp complex subunit ScpB [Chromatiales bacterium]